MLVLYSHAQRPEKINIYVDVVTITLNGKTGLRLCTVDSSRKKKCYDVSNVIVKKNCLKSIETNRTYYNNYLALSAILQELTMSSSPCILGLTSHGNMLSYL